MHNRFVPIAGGCRRRLLKAALALGLTAGVRPAHSAADLPAVSSPLFRAVPSTGERIVPVGLGTWQVFDIDGNDPARAQARNALELYAKLGGQVIDSSPMYGRSESVVGELWAQSGLQGHFFLATKVWTRGREEGGRQMRESMRRLRIRGALDLMQVHNLVDVETHLARCVHGRRTASFATSASRITTPVPMRNSNRC